MPCAIRTRYSRVLRVRVQVVIDFFCFHFFRGKSSSAYTFSSSFSIVCRASRIHTDIGLLVVACACSLVRWTEYASPQQNFHSGIETRIMKSLIWYTGHHVASYDTLGSPIHCVADKRRVRAYALRKHTFAYG